MIERRTILVPAESPEEEGASIGMDACIESFASGPYDLRGIEVTRLEMTFEATQRPLPAN